MSRRHGAWPRTDAEVPAFLSEVGVPGLVDVHIHFMPERMQQRVWSYFDAAEDRYGMAWPITYREDEDTRLARLRALGLRTIPALSYAHRPGMATWLNSWAEDFSARHHDVLHCATFFPEPGVLDYVGDAIDRGARLFKVHVEVGDFTPLDRSLDEPWGLLSDRGVPVVIHCGSAPIPGAHTGPAAIAELLRRHPGIRLVIAHLGMPEYHEFADLAEQHAGVYLDTTMAGTDFTNRFAPMPADYPPRLAGLREKVILGSDFPSIPYPYAHQLEALVRLDLGDDWLRAVLWSNGARLLDIPTPEPVAAAKDLPHPETGLDGAPE